jgi:NTE family protein
LDKSVTLVLGGIGAGGTASIGVLQSLREHKIKVKRIVASGISSLIAAQFALGRDPQILTEYFVQFFAKYQQKLWGLAQLEGFRAHQTNRALTNFSYFVRGVSFFRDNFNKISTIPWESLQPDLNAVFGNIQSADLKLPLAISVIDLSLNQEVLIEQANLMETLKAGIAFPGLFPPVTIDGHDLISSTLYCELPLAQLKKAWRPFLAVDIPSIRGAVPPRSAVEILAEIDQMRRLAIKIKLLGNVDRVFKLESISHLRENYAQIPSLVELAYLNTNQLLETEQFARL